MNYSAIPISRKNFMVSALVDWIDLAIQTKIPTQPQYIQRVLAGSAVLSGKIVYVAPIDPEPGNVARAFVIRLHDAPANNYRSLCSLLDHLQQTYPFTEEPKIRGIEVACDFKHKGKHNQAKADTLAMTYRLQSSLYVSDAYKFQDDKARPRQFVPGLGNKFLDSRGDRLDPEYNFRIGSKPQPEKSLIGDPVSWQVYFKQTDNNQKPLDPSQWRARVEVTLTQGAPKDIGLNNLSDLEGFDFRAFCQHFHFRRPIDPIKKARGNKFVAVAIRWHRSFHDATEQRGMHSFDKLGRYDKRLRRRTESSHIQDDRELADAVKGALKRVM
jgi:hypothetical protein